ncbi:MAG TPA: hypothetical protein VFQ39_01980 [Longimicrobium sp.]|nr:hypothetical protein [Longimicrobium sp.]
MREGFLVSRGHVASVDWLTLKRELFAETGSEDSASAILRGIERLGTDASIVHYECTPSENPRRYPGAPELVWSVRAVRQ